MTADLSALRQAFERQYGLAPMLLSEAPGRVNLIGEHTDYNSGFVLPMAIDRTVAVALSPRDDGNIRAFSLDFDQSDEFPAQRVRRFAGTRGGWRDYLRGVVWALLDSYVEVGGADIAITGDVPRGAGLSSSAALELAIAGALTADTAEAGKPRLRLDGEQIALVCQKAENLFVGVQSGVMDQMAAALGQAGHALLIDCRSLEVTPVWLPTGLAVVVFDSKVERRLAETPYNRRREECSEAARELGVESLRDATPEMLARLSGDLQKRARHVVTENARVLESVAHPEKLGALMVESHASLRDNFEVSTPELDALVEIALANGAAGARLTGAGFGGCTVNLVSQEFVAPFTDAVVAEYRGRTGLTADSYVCRAVDGLRVTDA